MSAPELQFHHLHVWRSIVDTKSHDSLFLTMSTWRMRAGSDDGEGSPGARTRRTQRSDATEDDARMDQVLQEPLRRLLAAPLDRRHPLLHRLRHPGRLVRRHTGRQRKRM